MVGIRRALGIHGERFGTLSSHGKGAYVAADPGKEVITPGIGTLTGDGRLIEEAARDVARAVFAGLALLKRWGERIAKNG